MDEQKVQELLNNALSQLKTDILAEVDNKNQGLASNIMKRVENKVSSAAPEAPSKASEDELLSKSLQKQLDDLKAQLAEKDARAIKAEKDAVISELIAKSDATGKSVLKRQIESLYADKLVKENDAWYVKDGDNVKEFTETFNEYLGTDEGSFFVKPSNTKGSGSSQGEKVTPSKVDNPDAGLAELFGL